MKSCAIVIFFVLIVSPVAFAQAMFNISYQPESKMYTVSIVPEATWLSPYNKVASAQIVLCVPSDSEFIPVITSKIQNAIWIDNAYVERPGIMPGFTFVSIALANGPVDNIAFAEGKEVALFTFVNASGDCPGTIKLIDNSDPIVKLMAADQFNVTQHIGVLGARGNAYTGIGQGVADCGTISEIKNKVNSIEHISISPLPANEQVTVSWLYNNKSTQQVRLLIFNESGQEVYQSSMTMSTGENFHKIELKDWSSGLYRLVFYLADGQRSAAQNLLVIH